jgi:diguanylate cyclase (GGDEF)-like protein
MALCGNFELSCGEADLSVSIGVACGEAGCISADELVKQADSAMYRAKSAGNSRPVLAAAV